MLLPSFLPIPLLLRGTEKRLVAMVLASSREAEAPGEVYHRVVVGALHSWWNDVKSTVEGLSITDRYEVLACVIILEHVTIVL